MDREKIYTLIAEAAERSVDEIQPLSGDTKLEDIGLSSIQFISLLVNIEDSFGIEILDSDLLFTKYGTIEKLFHMLEKYFVPTTVVKKCIVLDCDGVLWNGISGEENIYVTEAHTALQNELVSLYEKGSLLCLCSRNTEDNIRAAFALPDMHIRWNNIIAYRLGSLDKAQSIRELADELNLSVDSFIFIDDSDYELGLIESLLPEVSTIKADMHDALLIDRIREHFDSTSSLDTNRTELYRAHKDREKVKAQFASVDEYNQSLGTQIQCGIANSSQVERISELSQRTNQFNLSNAKYTVDEVDAKLHSADYIIISLSASDRYGDMGIVGAALVRTTEQTAVIEAFMLSCRVFGRGFENVLLDKVMALTTGRQLVGIYTYNGKNERFSGFYEENEVPAIGKI